MSTTELIRRLQVGDATLLQKMNVCRRRPRAGRVFAIVSRLGDGLFWYLVILGIGVAGGDPGAALRMLLTGAATTVLYKMLKDGIGRPRPCEAHAHIDVLVDPLDRWSFPSGHTMHAVCFTIMAAAWMPALAWMLVPFTGAVMLSRVVLGLHYPSDVLAGAIGGTMTATASLALF